MWKLETWVPSASTPSSPQSTWAWAPGATSKRRCIWAERSGIPSSAQISGRRARTYCLTRW